MKRYRKLWTWVWLGLWLMPIALGALVVSAPTVFVCGAVIAICVAITARWRSLDCLTVGIVGAALITGVAGLGPAGLGVALLCAATSPPVVRGAVQAVRRERGGRRAGPRQASVLTAEQLSGPVHCLGDRQLCKAWRDSLTSLDRAPSPTARLELVNLRQAYLDELETRDPVGFQGWLRADPRLLSDPARFLTLHDRDAS